MIFLILVLVTLNIVLVYSIFRDMHKRKQLGNIIFKLKHGIKSYLLTIFLVLAGVIVVYFSVKRVNQYSMSEFYGIKEIVWVIANSVVYMIMYIKLYIRVFTSGEIRDKGITMTNLPISYADIRGINWLSENKVQINYDPDIVYLFNRQFKEKWVVQDNQIVELKQLLQKKYYDVY